MAPAGVLAATIAEVRAVLGAAAAGAGVAAGVPAGARGAVAMPLVTSEEQVRCCRRMQGARCVLVCAGDHRGAEWAPAGSAMAGMVCPCCVAGTPCNSELSIWLVGSPPWTFQIHPPRLCRDPPMY